MKQKLVVIGAGMASGGVEHLVEQTGDAYEHPPFSTQRLRGN